MNHSPPEVLLIEDDQLQARFVRAMLEADRNPRYQLHHADRMSAALAHLQTREPDVVLMDLDLPDSAGLHSLSRVRAAAPHLPVIVLTANEDEAMRRQAVELGADDYLHKGRVDRHSLERSVTLAAKRKRAQDALHQSQQRFAELADNMDEVFWIAEPDGHSRIYVSPAYEQIWGRPPATLTTNAAAWTEAIHADDLASVQAALRAAGTGGEYQARYRIVHADGSPRWIQERGRPVRDADGRVSRMIGFARDISRHKQVEQALDQSEERFRALFLNSPMPTAVTSLSEGRFLRVNESFAALTGYTSEELQGHTSLELGLWAQPDARDPLAAELEQHGFLKSRAGRLRTKPGGERHLLISASRVQIGLSACAILMAEDITAHKQVEEQLRAQASLLDLARDAIMVCDLDDRVRYWNQGAVTLYGWTAAEARGRKLGELCQIENPARHADREQLLQTGQWFGQIHQRTHGGQRVIANSRRTLVRDDQGRPQAVLIINTDVTQHKKLEDQFYRAQRLESIGQLAGGIAHDFNNLLTVISGHCELLSADLPREHPMREAVAQISRAAAHAATLTRQLLAFSRQQTLELQVTDLNRVVADVEKMLRRLIEENVQLETRLAPGLPLVKVDAGQIEQVILNLVLNARDALNGEGTITLEIRSVAPPEGFVIPGSEFQTDRCLQLGIRDTGCGMTPEVQARIFEPFFTTKPVGKGTGLGLAVVSGIVKQSGGHLTVESQPGVGTTFNLYLPALPDAAAQQSETKISEPPRGQETILLVEDEAGLRRVTALLLERYGYTVLSAASGPQAVEIMRQHGPAIALVLTDVVMPEMSGHELAAALRADRPSLKVMFMSGYTDGAVIRLGVSGAGAAFVQKPFTPAALARKLRDVLDQPPAQG